MRGRNNKGSGLGVIVFGVTLLLILLFTAVNIVNSKVIENGYLSLRDAVQSAATGSVIHLLTAERDNMTQAQQNIIGRDDDKVSYDIYLQLALGYLINRNPDTSGDDTIVQTGEINNFIKLDHQKVVNNTMALLEDAVLRRKDADISNTNKYKILMFFIEPYRTDDTQKKYFNIIAYGNGDYNKISPDEPKSLKNISSALVSYPVASDNYRTMEAIYRDIQSAINEIVNSTYGESNFNINLNANGDVDGLVREMETYPHYLIVVKDFALPTIFDGAGGEAGDTSNGGNVVKSLFTSLSGDGTLKTPMCALNTGKVQRQSEDAGWSHR